MDKEECTLYGEALKAATPVDANRLTRKYEEEDFLRFQQVGFCWEPTRQMLINHMRQQMDDYERIRRRIRWVAITQALILIALLGVIIGR